MTTKKDIAVALQSHWPHSGMTADTLKAWSDELFRFGPLAIDAIRHAARTEKFPSLASIRGIAEGIRGNDTKAREAVAVETMRRDQETDDRHARTRAAILAMTEEERADLRERVLARVRDEGQATIAARLESAPMVLPDGTVNGLWRACAESELKGEQT